MQGMLGAAMHALDHVFVFCGAGAPEQQALVDAGLQVGERREHRGQGTANACFGFADCYLELIWLADEAAARDPMVKPLGLHERARWRETNASPFGVCLRASAPGEAPPFASWDYRPAWAPADRPIQMACNSGVIGEPMLFAIDRPFAPFGPRHTLSDAHLLQAAVTARGLAPMSMLREVAVPGLAIRSGDEPLLELTFAGATGRTLDLRPGLPLVMRW
jgi:hypothetical protein